MSRQAKRSPSDSRKRCSGRYEAYGRLKIPPAAKRLGGLQFMKPFVQTLLNLIKRAVMAGDLKKRSLSL